MPITRELEIIEELEAELEAVNFNHDQAKTLAKIIEHSHAYSHESLKEVIRTENKSLGDSIRNELKQYIKDLETRMAYAQKDLLLKIFVIISGTSVMLFAALKLFG